MNHAPAPSRGQVAVAALWWLLALAAGYLTMALLSISRCDGDGGSAHAQPHSPAADFCGAGGPWIVGALPAAGVLAGRLLGRRRGTRAITAWMGLGLVAGCVVAALLARQATQLSFD